MSTDYYLVLRVERDATESEIKRSFRRLALEWHPDRHHNAGATGRNAAEEMFKKLGEAYRVLSDEKRRADYDLTLPPVETDFYAHYSEKQGGWKKGRESHAANEALKNDAIKKTIVHMLAVEKQSSDVIVGRFDEICKKVFRGEYDEAGYLSDIKPAKSDAASCADRIQLIISNALQKQVRYVAAEIRDACNLEARLRDYARKAPKNLQEAAKVIEDSKDGLIPTREWLEATFKSAEFWTAEQSAVRAKLYQRINMKRGAYTHILLHYFVKNEEDSKCIKIFKDRVFKHQHLFSIRDMEDFYRKIKIWGKGKQAILDDNVITWEEAQKNHGDSVTMLNHLPICDLVISRAESLKKGEEVNCWLREKAKDYGSLEEFKRPFVDFDFVDVDAGSGWIDWKQGRLQAKAKADENRHKEEIKKSGAAIEKVMSKVICSFDAALERYEDVFIRAFQGEFDKKAYSATVFLNEQSDTWRVLKEVCREFGLLVDIAGEIAPALAEDAAITRDELDVEAASVNETTSSCSFGTAKKYGEYALKVRNLLGTFKQTDVNRREAMERTYAMTIALLDELSLDMYLPLRNKIYKYIPFSVGMYVGYIDRIMDFLRVNEEYRVIGTTLKNRIVSEASGTFKLADAYLALKMGARFSKRDVESIRWKLREVDEHRDLWHFEQAALRQRRV